MPVMPIKAGDTFMREVASVVRDHVGNAIRPIATQNALLMQLNETLAKRIEHLERRYGEIKLPDAGPPGAPGKDGQPGAPGRDGKSVTIDEVMPALNERVDQFLNEKAAQLDDMLNAIPKPKDGMDGKDGSSVTVDDVMPALLLHAETMQSKMENRLKQIIFDNLPKDGKDGKDGEHGRDGANVVSAMIDRGGNLILNLSNGQAINVGMIVGKDGAPGPAGRDGLGIDNLDVIYDGDRTAIIQFASGDVKKEFPLVFPNVIYRGIWKEGKYQRGDSVTVGGSSFIALTDTDKQPETSKEWQLAVKRGHNGKDGERGKEGKEGKPGRDGRDLTQLGPDGSKWR